MKADRLPMWQFRRLTPEQRDAYDQLRWRSPNPSERARLKKTLGWRRTHEETIALARELVERGMVKLAIQDELGITDRHLRRVLAEVLNPEKEARNPSIHAAETDITCESNGVGHRLYREPPPLPCRAARPPLDGFSTFDELDRWLEEHRT